MEYLEDLNLYIKKFLKSIWEDPFFVSELLINSNISDIKENLASFFVNNFYENILSSYYIEDNLMYVLTLILKNEINSLDNSKDPEKFLNDNSPCKYLLSEIRKKNDIQNYFKSIIYYAVENLEIQNYEAKINLDINQIIDETQKKMNNIKNKKINKNKDNMSENIRKSIISDIGNINGRFNSVNIERLNTLNLDSSFLSKENEYTQSELNNDKFVTQYLPNLQEKDLENKLKEYKDNLNMQEYIRKQINQCQNNKEIFSNEHIIDSIYKTNDSEILYNIYKENFFKVIHFIDKILDNLMNNIYLLPNSLKCFCKIISILINKRFPNISTIEKNSFIGVFFFKIIFSPILKNPSIEALINDFIISRNSLSNFSIISDIINQLISGNFFTKKFLTPFNNYFLEKMPLIIKLFEQMTNITLNPFIEKLITQEIDENYKFDYFEQMMMRLCFIYLYVLL